MAKLTEYLNEPRGGTVNLLAWCDEQNAKRIMERMERWYFVAVADGVERIDSLQGCDANNIRLMLDGKLADFAGWAPSRMDGYRRWLWSVAEKGMIRTREAA
jgi:hypothetical protein